MYLVSMTRKMSLTRKKASGRGRSTRPTQPGRWLLQDAKARFSELVRRVKSDGPQLVTVHGREEVVVICAEEFRKLRGERTGRALVEVMRASPWRDVEIEPSRERMPVRDVDL
jgi:prevent-host-death family protein